LRELRIAEVEADPESGGLIEQRRGLRARHLGLEEGIDLGRIFHVPAGKEGRQGELRKDHQIGVPALCLAHEREQARDGRCPGLVPRDGAELGGRDGDSPRHA
jgi:hypothetical protein